MRMNAEIERETAALVSQADEVLRGQADLLNTPKHQRRVNDDTELFSDEESAYAHASTVSGGASEGSTVETMDLSSPGAMLDGILRRAGNANAAAVAAAAAVGEAEAAAIAAAIPNGLPARPPSRSGGGGGSRGGGGSAARPQSARGSRPSTARSTSSRPSTAGGGRPASRRGRADMLVIDTEGDAALEAVISGEMGEEATLRFLKAKLKVMQEEIVDLSTQLKTNRSKASDAEGQLKKLAVAQTKSQKSAESAQAAVAKHKHAAEDAARKYQNEQAQNKLLRKELEVIKRSQKQSDGRYSALEVRLRRAQEDADNAKDELRRTRDSRGGSSGSSRGQVEALEASNKVLATQKRELLTAFKKQLKLIDILKRQKLHIEAARVLQFSEDEFVKAMDWGTAVA